MTKTQRNQKIHVNTVSTTIAQLKQLEAKPKLELTLRETIASMETELKNAINKGYSYKELSEILAKQKIMISAGTLKQYMNELNKSSSSRPMKKSTRKKSNVSQTEIKPANNDSNNNSAKEKLEKDNSKNQKTNKEKAIALLNADIRTNSDNNNKKSVFDKRTLPEKLRDPSYMEKLRDPSYVEKQEEEMRQDFNQF